MASDQTETNNLIATSISLSGYIRGIIRFIAIILALLILLPLHFLWRLFQQPSPWPQIFLWSVATMLGAKFNPQGQRLRKDVFYIANHISWLDILVIAGGTGSTFISNDEIKKWPVIGWLCQINRTIFVSRSDRMGVARQIVDIRNAIDAKYPITIFPEGTTSNGNQLLPFKPSLFAAVAPPPKQIMIQPVFLDYGHLKEALCWVGDESAANNAKRIFARHGSFRVTLNFLTPFDPVNYADRKAICAEAEQRMIEALSASMPGRTSI